MSKKLVLLIMLATTASCASTHEQSAKKPLVVRGVLALTPAPDPALLHEQKVCGHVIDGLMGGSPDQVPDRYRWGDPMPLAPDGVPQVLIIGKHDSGWGPSGRRYFDAAKKRGDNVRLIEAKESGHFEVIDPDSTTWRLVLDAARELLFGNSGYVAMYRRDEHTDSIYVPAFRHVKEAGY